MKQLDDPGRLALLVVDVQAGAVTRGPYRGEEVLQNIGDLIVCARGAGVEVVYVQHDGQPGDDDEAGLPGWEIYAGIRPEAGERVVRKRHSRPSGALAWPPLFRSRGPGP